MSRSSVSLLSSGLGKTFASLSWMSCSLSIFGLIMSGTLGATVFSEMESTSNVIIIRDLGGISLYGNMDLDSNKYLCFLNNRFRDFFQMLQKKQFHGKFLFHYHSYKKRHTLSTLQDTDPQWLCGQCGIYKLIYHYILPLVLQFGHIHYNCLHS